MDQRLDQWAVRQSMYSRACDKISEPVAQGQISGLLRADYRPERADFRPEKADFRLERADSRPTLKSKATDTSKTFIVPKIFIFRNSDWFCLKAHYLPFIYTKFHSTGSSS